MSSAAPRDRRDHDTSLPGTAAVAAFAMLAALALQLSPQRAAAQSPPCTAIQDDAERLACYDRALRSAEPPTPAPAVRAPAPQSPVPQSPVPQSPVPQSSAPQSPAVQSPAPPSAPASASRAPAASAPAAAAAPA